MFACKWSNFSIIPEQLKVKPPKKYKFPTITRGEDYKWDARYSSSDEETESENSESEEDSSESESDSSEEDSESESATGSESESE